MARITKAKTTGIRQLNVTMPELRTLTIALALLDVLDLEQEIEEQKLTRKDVIFDPLPLFNVLTKETGLYPFSDVAKSKQGIKVD